MDYMQVGVLVVSEVGNLSLRPEAGNVPFQLVNDRYLRRKAIAFTSDNR